MQFIIEYNNYFIFFALISILFSSIYLFIYHKNAHWRVFKFKELLHSTANKETNLLNDFVSTLENLKKEVEEINRRPHIVTPTLLDPLKKKLDMIAEMVDTALSQRNHQIEEENAGELLFARLSDMIDPLKKEEWDIQKFYKDNKSTGVLWKKSLSTQVIEKYARMVKFVEIDVKKEKEIYSTKFADYTSDDRLIRIYFHNNLDTDDIGYITLNYDGVADHSILKSHKLSENIKQYIIERDHEGTLCAVKNFAADEPVSMIWVEPGLIKRNIENKVKWDIIKPLELIIYLK